MWLACSAVNRPHQQAHIEYLQAPGPCFRLRHMHTVCHMNGTQFVPEACVLFQAGRTPTLGLTPHRSTLTCVSAEKQKGDPPAGQLALQLNSCSNN